LTGSRQHVGNYPGVTVEKKEGHFFHAGHRINVIDLPGTYSLTANSLDEKVARDFIMYSQPDVVVDVIDATNFERSLYLTSQLVELGVRLVLVLNMSDRARASGQALDLKMIRERLSCEVVETVGSKGAGIAELKKAITTAALKAPVELPLDYGEEINAAIVEVQTMINADGAGLMRPYSDRWVSLKLFEDDPEAKKLLALHHVGSKQSIAAKVAEIRHKMEGHHGDSMPILVAERRYGFAAGLYREVVRQEAIERHSLSEKIDNIVTSRWLGIPLFLMLMYAVFYATFKLSEIPMRLIEKCVAWLGGTISAHWPAAAGAALKSLITNGIIDGVGGVLVFLPAIVLLFLGIALMEDTGYMARVAFIMDRLMHKIGLHGKSFIPMVIGFGCSVPAIMATRTIEHRRDRIATMLVIPLMSCGAKLPIYSLFIPAFFPEAWRAKILWGIYVAGIVFAIFLVRILRSTLLRGESTPFVMELPPYRMPALKGIIIHMWERTKLFLRKAATIILAISIIMWALTSYPKPAVYEIDRQIAAGAAATEQEVSAARAAEALDYSIAGKIGHALEVVVRPLGFDWRISTALIGAFAAKEVFISQLGIVFSISEAGKDSFSLRDELRRNYTPLTALCVMIFTLIATPCMATFAVTRRESGRWRWALFQFAGLTVFAYIVTMVVYQIGKLFLWQL
jgi:ferrous iron transport protein B